MRAGEAWGLALLMALALCSSSCLLPTKITPSVAGTVVDAVTGNPVEGAIVVVRFDGRYGGDELPDRDLIAHSEAVTDASGRFEVAMAAHGGPMVWPLYRMETRVAGVIAEGYRCPEPRASKQALRIHLTAALDDTDRRGSCRPVPVQRGEAVGYMTAWRELFPARSTPAELEQQRQIDRLLAGRSHFGFGTNCQGPVHDMSLAPDGRRAGLVVVGASGPEIQLLDLDSQGGGPLLQIGPAENAPPRRLAWANPNELVLWHPTSSTDRVNSRSLIAGKPFELVWASSRALPASIDVDAPEMPEPKHSRRHKPVDPSDLSDESEARWHGRAFTLDRRIDPVTGLSADRLRISHEDGRQTEIDIPGEACGGSRYGRPQQRVSAGGGSVVDLRFVEGGCHAVQIDLEKGSWAVLDSSDAEPVCRVQRRVPPNHLSQSLRGWTRELHLAFANVGADPESAYALRIEPDGSTRALARSPDGKPVTVVAPRFPIETPLRRIDVTTVAPTMQGERLFPSTRPETRGALEPL